MPELIALLIFVAALIVIEAYYIRHNQKTISQHVQELVHSWMPAGALIGFVAGWFLCHFTQ
jgi:hypothetical protein